MTGKVICRYVSLVLIAFLMVPGISLAEETLLQKVIKGAQEEGKVVAMGGGGALDLKIMNQKMKEAFGVEIDTKMVPGGQLQVISKLAMEKAAGIAPSYEYMTAAFNNLITSMRPEGLVAEVDWKQLIADYGLNPDYYIPPPGDYVIALGSIQGIVYNPKVISEEDLPKSYKDFVNPEYKARFGFLGFPTAVADVCYYLGMADDSGVQFVREIVANKASIEKTESLVTKVILGELPFALADSQNMCRVYAKDPNAPVKFALLNDFVLVTEKAPIVIEGAKNFNAAVLGALFCSTPQGIEYEGMVSGLHDYRDPETMEYKILEGAKKMGTPVIFPSRDPKYAEWLVSPEARALSKKISGALKGR